MVLSRRDLLLDGDGGADVALRDVGAVVLPLVLLRLQLASPALLSSRLFDLVAQRHVREPPAVRATPVHAPGVDDAVLTEEVTTIDHDALAGRRLLHAYSA